MNLYLISVYHTINLSDEQVCHIVMNCKLINQCIFIVYQGGFRLPLSGSARIMVSMLWIVVIVIVCTYCANLTVYLTVFERKMPFSNLVEAIQDPSVEFYVTSGTVGINMLQVSSKNNSF